VCRQCCLLECLGFDHLQGVEGRGVGVRVFMGGGFSGGCQRLYWEIWSGCH